MSSRSSDSTDYNAFVCYTTYESAPMHMVVLDNKQRVSRTYDVPPGFQLDRYLATLFPTTKRHFCYEGGSVKATILSADGQTIETHVGFHRAVASE